MAATPCEGRVWMGNVPLWHDCYDTMRELSALGITPCNVKLGKKEFSYAFQFVCRIVRTRVTQMLHVMCWLHTIVWHGPYTTIIVSYYN